MTQRLFMSALTGLALLFQPAAHAEEVLSLGIASYLTKSEMEARYQPLANYLASQLQGTRIQLLVLNRAEMEEALRLNKLDFLLTNPGHYLRLRNQNSFTGVLATQELLHEGQTTKSLGSVILVSAQRADLTRLADLKGRRIATPGQEKLGGYQAAAFELLQAGVKLPDHAQVIEMDSQNAVIAAVLSGRVDAGFTRTGEIERLAAEGKLDWSKIKVLNRQTLAGFPFVSSTRLYPEWPFVAMPHVNEHTVRKVAASLLSLSSEQAATRAAGIAGFAPPADYLAVEQLARALHLPPYDTVPELTLKEIWQQHAAWIGGITALLALLSIAAIWLVLMNRRAHRVAETLLSKDQALRASYASLQKNEQMLNRSQEIAHLGSWELDLVQNRLSWSEEVYRIFGLSAQQSPATYEGFLEVVHPQDRQLVNDAYTQSIAKGQDTYEVEHRILRHGTGEIRHVREKCQHQRDASGKVIRSIGMVHDITAQTRAAEAQLRNEAQLRTIIDVSPIPYAINDAQGNITYLNRTFTETFGYDQHAIPTLQEWWSKAYPDAQYRDWVARAWAQRLERSNKENSVFEPIELEIRCQDGSTRTALTSSVPLGQAFAGANLVVLYDITERKQAETVRAQLQDQLLQAQKMESLGQLTGGIAHDFNNMLGAILGYAELIQKANTDTPASPERTLKFAAEILAAGNRAKELIAQMLAFSRLSPERNSNEAPITLLQPVVKEVTQLLRSSIPSSIDLNYQISETTLRARVQPVQLHQILLNLVINARDAVKEHGHIDVKLALHTGHGTCASCHAPFDGDFVELSVGDDGTGLPDHLLNKVFDPFFTTKDVGKGSGMGLSVVHGIVHAMSGHITVDSAVNRGTIMRILLPAVSAKPPTATLPAKPPQNNAESTLSGLRIMVVDDEKIMTTMLQELLSLHGAEVTTYTEAPKALANFQHNANRFDLVITDETMPNLSGLDLSRRMLKIRPNLPVILCTGYSAQVNADIAKQNGIAGFMYKPIQLKELLRLSLALCKADGVQEKPPGM